MSDQPTLDVAENGDAEEIGVTERLNQAFLDYSMSVIVGRALPDVRDGLKPVQRRIVYSMWESGLRPDRPYRKCASAVGEVMKKYHPHGDSSIYEALVRMGQPWNMSAKLVDGQGNFGSEDGDPPAAMRYTEAKLEALATELVAGIDEDTVDFRPNYDGYDEEPEVLPSRFPNLLVNGAYGIAVGMATKMAPHNLGEVIDAALMVLDDPDVSLSKLMKKMPAPDFPTGARIIDTDGIEEAFRTGRGAVTLEAVATTEVRSGNMPRIVVTEVPFEVNKATLQEKVAKMVNDGDITSIRDIRDESSRDGMRVVFELKRGENPARVLAELFDKTRLRMNFNVNNVCIVDGKPQTVNLKQLLSHYVDHQRDVVTRRTNHRKARAEARLHVIEGLLIALDNIDAVVKLIRGSESSAAAKDALEDRFDMSEIQAQAVLDMPLRRLAQLEAKKLSDEADELRDRIDYLNTILDDRAVLDGVIRDEMSEIKDQYALPRRSHIVGEGVNVEGLLEGGSSAGFAAQDVTLFVTEDGTVKAMPTRRASAKHNRVRDPLRAVVRADTDAKLLVVDEQGNGFRVDAADVPVGNARSSGASVVELLGHGPEHPVAGAVALVEGTTVVTVSERGLVKRTEAEEYLDARTRDIVSAGVKNDDRIVSVAVCRDDDHLLLAHSGGYAARFAADEVRTMGRTAAGVAGMKVPDDERIVSLTVVPGGSDGVQVITLDSAGEAKVSPAEDFPVKGRNIQGLQTLAEPTVFCGVAADLHYVNDDGPEVLRRSEVPAAGRRQKPTAVADGPVQTALPEQVAAAPPQGTDGDGEDD